MIFGMESSRGQSLPAVPVHTVRIASGVVKLSPGPMRFIQRPNSRSAKPPGNENPLSLPTACLRLPRGGVRQLHTPAYARLNCQIRRIVAIKKVMQVIKAAQGIMQKGGDRGCTLAGVNLLIDIMDKPSDVLAVSHGAAHGKAKRRGL